MKLTCGIFIKICHPVSSQIFKLKLFTGLNNLSSVKPPVIFELTSGVYQNKIFWGHFFGYILNIALILKIQLHYVPIRPKL